MNELSKGQLPKARLSSIHSSKSVFLPTTHATQHSVFIFFSTHYKVLPTLFSSQLIFPLLTVQARPYIRCLSHFAKQFNTNNGFGLGLGLGRYLQFIYTTPKLYTIFIKSYLSLLLANASYVFSSSVDFHACVSNHRFPLPISSCTYNFTLGLP